MNKQEFLAELRRGLQGLPQADIEERVNFYSEMIDDRMEDGLTESEAVAEIGSVGEVVSQILSDIPLTRLVKEKIKPKRPVSPWAVVLLILGFPLWLPLVIAFSAIILSIYIVVWSVIISLWAIEVTVMAGILWGIFCAVSFILQGNAIAGLISFAAGLCFAGLSIYLFFGCAAVSKGILFLTKKAAVGVKHMIVGKGN